MPLSKHSAPVRPLHTEQPGGANRTGRILYILEAAFEYFISILVSGAYLAALLAATGVSDRMTGVISSVQSLACAAQLAAVLTVRSGGPAKRWIVCLQFAAALLFVCLYAVPLAALPQGVKVGAFAVLITAALIIQQFASPFKIQWQMSLVADGKRGVFTAYKEMASLVGGMLFTLLMGGLIDRLRAAGQQRTAFVLCALTLLVLAALQILLLLFTREPRCESKSERKPLSHVLRATFGDRTFRKIILLNAWWSFGLFFSFSYFGVYQIKELGFSLSYVAVLGILYGVARVCASRFFGSLADRRSWAEMMTVCFVIAGAAFFINTFTTPANGKILFAVFNTVFAVSMAGINSGLINCTFDYVKREDRAYALGVKNAVGGVCGFLASLLGGAVLSRIQQSGSRLFGSTVYAQQILSLGTAAAVFGLALYMRCVVVKLERIHETQRTEESP